VTEGEEQLSVCAAPASASGEVVFEFTVTVDGAVHPFAGSVTVKVYVPAAFTVGVAVFPPEIIPGPAQLKVTPAVAEDPFNVVVADEHVSACDVPALASGTPAEVFTATELNAVHPFAGSVTVNV
jgi:hypothetical protein